MQARLDFLIPPSCCPATVPATAGCCARSTGSEDDGPALLALLADAAERIGSFLARNAYAALRAAALRRL